MHSASGRTEHPMRHVRTIDCAFTCCAALFVLFIAFSLLVLLALQSPAAQRAINCRVIDGVSCDVDHASRVTYGHITG